MNRKLRDVRIQKGWSQQDAAHAVNVALRTYQRWEHEQHIPNFASRRLLRDAFEASDEELGFGPVVEDDQQTTTNRGEQIIQLTGEQAAILKLVLEESDMTQFDPSRRETLRQLMAALGMAASEAGGIMNPEPWERLAANSTPSLDMDTFFHFYNLIERCWGLINSRDMFVANQVLSSFLPKMIQVAPFQRDAAILAAHGLRLQSLLQAHTLRVKEMLPLCLQSVEYARLADDANTLSASLSGLAVAYKYAGRLDDSFRTYQEALMYSNQASPLLRTRVYAGAASAFAQRGRGREADFYLDLAYEEFPDRPQDDPNFLSADNGVYMLAYYKGISYLAINRAEEAYKAFESYKQHSSGTVIPERNRLEILNHQGRAAIMVNDLERYVFCLEAGVSGAIALKSKKRFDEAVTIFQQGVPKQWRIEPQVRRVVEQYWIPTEGK
jgi:transcriptional regulator with XRE-family HTH domain/tetratricopeptide (TPR) repeat protein